MEELQFVEHVVREDEGVVEQCVISGISREDMHKVYCDRKYFNFSGHFSPFFLSASSASMRVGVLITNCRHCLVFVVCVLEIS